jgi:hypothetical protein
LIAQSGALMSLGLQNGVGVFSAWLTMRVLQARARGGVIVR